MTHKTTYIIRILCDKFDTQKRLRQEGSLVKYHRFIYSFINIFIYSNPHPADIHDINKSRKINKCKQI